MKYLVALAILIATSFFSGFSAGGDAKTYSHPLMVSDDHMASQPSPWGVKTALSSHFRIEGLIPHPHPMFAAAGVRVMARGNAFATEDGFITAYHCIGQAADNSGSRGWKANRIVLTDHRGDRWPVYGFERLIDQDGVPVDAARLLMVEEPPCALLQVYRGELSIQAQVRMRGYWGDQGFMFGKLMSIDGNTHQYPAPEWWDRWFGGEYIGVDFVANHGLSGCPLLYQGRVVGLLSAGTPDGIWFTRIN